MTSFTNIFDFLKESSNENNEHLRTLSSRFNISLDTTEVSSFSFLYININFMEDFAESMCKFSILNLLRLFVSPKRNLRARSIKNSCMKIH